MQIYFLLYAFKELLTESTTRLSYKFITHKIRKYSPHALIITHIDNKD